MGHSRRENWRLEFHKALGNEVRLQIVDFLAEGEQCQCDIFPKFGLAQSTVSAYLTKPVLTGTLCSTLSRILSRSMEEATGQELITRHSVIEAKKAAKRKFKFKGHVLLAEDNLTNRMVALAAPSQG